MLWVIDAMGWWNPDWSWLHRDGELLDEGFSRAVEKKHSNGGSILLGKPGSRSHNLEILGHVVKICGYKLM